MTKQRVAGNKKGVSSCSELETSIQQESPVALSDLICVKYLPFYNKSVPAKDMIDKAKL